jgi:hypothetical protein
MSGYPRASILGAAISVALLASACTGAAVSVSPTPGPTPTPAATPAPTVAPTPAPSPSATTGTLSLTSSGPVPIAAGTYTAGDPFAVRVTFTVPAGWAGNIGGPNAVFLAQADGPGGVAFTVGEQLYADPCHADKGFVKPAPGPSVDDLATVLAHMPGLAATTPAVVTVGGYQGKQLTLTAPANASGCTDGSFGVWQLPLGAINELTPGEADRLWIVDVAGERLVIEAAETPGQAAATAEVQAVLDSLKLAPLP